MEINIMKKFIISSVLVSVILFFSLPAFAQPAGGDEQKEQIGGMRQRWDNMSAEEKEKARAEMRNRATSRGLGREGQLKAVAAIEEQVAKLKDAVESMDQGRDQYQNMSEEQRTKYRKKVAQVTRTRQQAIEEIEQQLSKLKFREPRRPQVVEPQARVNELREIHQLAIKEKAIETAKRLGELIAGYQQRESQSENMGPGPREPREERAPRPRQPRTEENQ
jgi:hypothetical protein